MVSLSKCDVIDVMRTITTRQQHFNLPASQQHHHIQLDHLCQEYVFLVEGGVLERCPDRLTLRVAHCTLERGKEVSDEYMRICLCVCLVSMVL
jgi:hypothetical protein